MPEQARQLFYRILIGSLCLLALFAIVAIVSGDFNNTDEHILGTLLALVLYATTSFLQVPLLERRPDAAIFAYFGVALSVLGFVTMLNSIWSAGSTDDEWRLAAILLVLTLANANVSVLVARRREGDTSAVTTVFWVTIGAIVVIALMLVAALADDGSDFAEGYWRFLGVAAVVWVLGLVLLPTLRKAQRVAQASGRGDG